MSDDDEWRKRYDEAWSWLHDLDNRHEDLFFRDEDGKICSVEEFLTASEHASYSSQLCVVSRPFGHMLMTKNEICGNIARGDWEMAERGETRR